MGFYVNPSGNGFKSVINSKKYVDKSELIAFTNSILNTPDMLICSSRPRRFGKSFAAKMLVAYYSKGADSRVLFENLKIAGMDEERKRKALEKDAPNAWESVRFEENLNKYDVIYLDITSFISKVDDIHNTVRFIHADVIRELKEEYPGCIREGVTQLASALMDVKAKTGNKFYIIIDEWDALFREAKEDTAQQKSYIQLLRSLFKTAETPEFISGAYMTGILPIKKYGTQSALTDFKEYTMLRPGPLAPFIGFTEAEVKNLCERHGLDFEETQKWYDGYRFSKFGHIYCPNSIMELVSYREYDSYWTKTETYESLRDYIDLNYDGLKDGLIDMLGGNPCPIDPNTFQNDMTTIASRDDIFTLLVHLGYLAYDFQNEEVFIPNEEVRKEFVRAVKEGRRPELAQAVKLSDRLLNATLRMDEDAVANLIEAFHLSETTPDSYNDEQALRAVIKTAYLTCKDHYLRFEEIAGGRGYSDILFLPRAASSKPALLVELKWDKSASKAITQIKEKQYAEVLKRFGYEGRLLLIGINYSTKTGKHSCKIEEYA